MDLLTKSSLKFAMITLRFLFAIGSDVREILSDLRNPNQQFQELTDFAEIQNSKFEGLKYYCANKWNFLQLKSSENSSWFEKKKQFYFCHELIKSHHKNFSITFLHLFCGTPSSLFLKNRPFFRKGWQDIVLFKKVTSKKIDPQKHSALFYLLIELNYFSQN